MPDDRIELDVLDGETEVLGTDRFAGAQPTRPQVNADPWGPADMSFQIPRQPHWDSSDLLPETPVRYYRDDELVFGGRITDATRDDQPGTHMVSVTCQGWQFALDDDVFSEAWLLGKLDPWSDLRNAVVVDMNAHDPLGLYAIEGPSTSGDVQITSGNQGALALTLPAGQTINDRQKIGAWLDARAYPSFQQIWVSLYRSLGGSDTNLHLIFAGAASPHFLSSSRVEYWNIALTDLDARHGQRIDPIVGVAPMPYMGLFMELAPPPLPPPPPTINLAAHIYGECDTSDTVHDGAVTITDPDVEAGDILFALISCSGSAAADNDGSVVPPDETWSQALVATMVDSGTHRMESWGCEAGQEIDSGGGPVVMGMGPDFTWQLRVDTGGYNLSVHYFRFKGGTTPGTAWSDVGNGPFFHPSIAGVGNVPHPFRSYNPGAVFIGVSIGSGGSIGGGPTVPTGATNSWHQSTHYETGPSPPISESPSYGMQVRVDEHVDEHPAMLPDDLWSANYVDTYAWDPASPIDVHGLAFVFEQAQPVPPDASVSETASSDIKLLIDTLRMAPVSTFMGSTGKSTLSVARIVRDAVALCPQLDPDVSLLPLGTGPFIDSMVADNMTPREMIDSANSIRQARIRIRADRRAEMDALPTAPAWQVSKVGSNLSGGGASSQGMANATLITGQDALGRPFIQKRGSYDALGATATLEELTQADVGASDTPWWEFNEEPPTDWAGSLLGGHRIGDGVFTMFTDPPGDRGEAQSVSFLKLGEDFKVGAEYLLNLRAGFPADSSLEGVPFFARIYIYGRNYRVLSRIVPINAPDTDEVVWPIDFVAVDPWMHLYIVAGVSSVSTTELDSFFFKGLDLSLVKDATLLDRRGVRRTISVQIEGEATQDKADALAKAQLTDVTRVVFRGSITCSAYSIEPFGGGVPVENAHLLSRTGDMIRLLDEIDPVTGAAGRNARIVGVSFDAESGSVTLELDSTRHDLEKVQAQQAVLP